MVSILQRARTGQVEIGNIISTDKTLQLSET